MTSTYDPFEQNLFAKLSFLPAALIILYFLKRFFSGGWCKLNIENLQNKVVIITGANTGIGLETAIRLAQLKAIVILACRNPKLGKEAQEEVRIKSENQNVFFAQLDLSDLNSIRVFSEQFLRAYKQLDILINNAGVMAIKTRQLTEDGFEMQVGTNHLGHFYLTQLLSDILKKTPQSRVINVSSSAHRFPRKEINLSTLMNQETYSPWPQYGKTKLLNIYFSQLIFSKYGVKSVSLHPGAVRTELLRNTVNNIFMKIFFVIIYPFWWFFSKNCVQGAQTTLQCALIPYESLENGKFYADCKVASTTSLAVQPGEAEKAWNWSVNMIQDALKKKQ